MWVCNKVSYGRRDVYAWTYGCVHVEIHILMDVTTCTWGCGDVCMYTRLYVHRHTFSRVLLR